MVNKKCPTGSQPELRGKCSKLLKYTHSLRPDIILSNGTEHKCKVKKLTNQFKQIDLQLRAPANVQVATT